MEQTVTYKLSEINQILEQLGEIPLKYSVTPWASLKNLTDQKLKEQQEKENTKTEE